MKPLKQYYESAYCDIFYNPNLKTIQSVWKGIYLDGKVFRTILNKLIAALWEYKSNIIIADARNMKMIWKEDREWIIKEWYPNAIRAGFRCQALIVTSESYNEIALKTIVEKYDDIIVETGYFTSFSDAETWVKNKKKISQILNLKN